MAAVEKWDEEMNAVGHREAQGAINLLSCRTDVAVNATEKRMNFGWFVGSYGETRGVATTEDY